jgi:Rps23 Pro-64 3,4-dihydroxylase Tpa1-like proline 4-hydroxylase
MKELAYSPAFDPLDLDRETRAYAAAGHVRIRDIFKPATAIALNRHLAKELEWWRVVNQGERTWDLGPDSIRAMAENGDRPLLEAVHKGARDGFQFMFDSVRVADDPVKRCERGWPIDHLIEALNSPEWLEIFKQVTGSPKVAKVDGQATRYLPGHFLTAHDDNVDGKGRIAAYVIGLTPNWRAEWGGLLLFHDDNGDISRGLTPCFNAIHIFSVPQRHSVSLVAPFAIAPRLSITGWLRM